MKAYKVKYNDGTFLARILAENEEGAATAILYKAGVLPEAEELVPGEVSYADDKKISALLTESSKNVDELRQELIVEPLEPREKRDFAGKTCIYCGIRPSTKNEGDHVVARGFFAEGNRSNTIVNILVPACEQCNSVEKSNAEQEMISVLTMSLKAANHPDVQQLIGPGGAVRRSLEKKQGPWPKIRRSSREVIIAMPETGILVPTGLTSIDWSKFEFVLDKIAKGLYYHQYNNRLAGGYESYAHQINDSSWDKQLDFLTQKGGIGPIELGDGVFTYAFAILDGDPNITLWLMSFYKDAFRVVVTTGPRRSVGDVLDLHATGPILPPVGSYVLVEKGELKSKLIPVSKEIKNGEIKRNGDVVDLPNFCLAGFVYAGMKVAGMNLPPSSG